MKLVCHNNGKEKFDSFDISFKDDYNFSIKNASELFSHDLSDVHGYGESIEDALSDFKRKIAYLFDEYRAIEKILFETNVYTDNIIQVDCFGKEIKNGGINNE